MGEVLPFARPAPRCRIHLSRPCACPDCRRCGLCASLVSDMPRAADHCSFERCPMKGAMTVDDVLKGWEPPKIPAPAAPKKK